MYCGSVAVDLLRQIAEHNERIITRIHKLVDTSGAYAATASGSNLERQFGLLAEQWRRETGPYSSVSRKVQHPAYQKIIAMGEPAIPLILREMRERPAHWFTALRSIAKSPPENERADMSRATAVWLKWGQERGYLD